MIRSEDEAEYEQMRERFRELCEAAALATRTSVQVTFSRLADPDLVAAAWEAFRAG